MPSPRVTVAWAMEAYERGLLTKEDTDGIDLRFGNSDAAVAAMENWLKGKESWENFCSTA